MSANSSIGWTDHTFNPWWGCVRVSPGCEHCYAETFSRRIGEDVWGPASTTSRRFFGDKHWAEPERWNAKAEAAGVPARVFCASMADVFEAHPELPEPRERLFELIERTPWLDWQLLTKRPENVVDMVPALWRAGFPRNVWIGTSVEDQRRANERVDVLLSVPAWVRFLSVEPLLARVRLKFLAYPCPVCLGHSVGNECEDCHGAGPSEGFGVEWVIVGGESGPGARPMNLSWARDVVSECVDYGVPVYVKQLGKAYGSKGDAKAEDVERFPEDLRRREFPRSAPR